MHFGRIATSPGFLDLVDIITRGGSQEWQALYAAAKEDAGLRAEISLALTQVDPELASSRAIWEELLERMGDVQHPPAVASREISAPALPRSVRRR